MIGDPEETRRSANDISQLAQARPGLASALSSVPMLSALSFVSPLLMEPAFHANTIRLEALVHMIVAFAGDRGRVRKSDVSDWLNRRVRAGALAYVEDPPEDVFVGNVSLRQGDFRLLLGVYEGADFHVQTLLDVLETVPKGPMWPTLWGPLLALLKLSDAGVSRAGLSRQALGGGTSNGRVNLPSDAEYSRLRGCVHFTKEHLDELGIELADLEPFVFNLDDRARLLNEEMGWSSLDRAPLLRVREAILFALPASVTIALRAFALRWCEENGVSEVLQRKAVGRQRELVQDALRSFRTKPPPDLDLETKAAGDFLSIIAKFDSDKFVHCLTLFDDLQVTLAEGLNSRMPIPKDKVEDHIDIVISACREALPRAEGISIVIIAGVGRGYFFGFGHKDGWVTIGVSLHDFVMLSHLPEFDLLVLWKMLQQSERLAFTGIQVMNLSGILNELAYWRAADRQLHPTEFPERGPGLVTLPTDAIKDLRAEVRSGLDTHASRRGGEYLRVSRESVSSYYREVAKLPIYVSYDLASQGALVGVAESEAFSIWVEVHDPPSGHYQSLAYLLWSAVLRWAHRIISVVSPFAEGDRIRRVVLSLDSADNWPTDPDSKAIVSAAPVVAEATGDLIKLTITSDILPALRQEKNEGERLLVEAIVSAIAPSADASSLAREVCINDDARFVHVLQAQTYLDYASASASLKARFIDQADVSDARVGLVSRSIPGERIAGPFTGAQDALKVLNACVQQLWVEVRSSLEENSQRSVLRACLDNWTALAIEEQEWIKTARAVLALHSDRSDVLATALREESKRNVSSLASRVLAEMAVCHGAAREGALPNSVFDSLLAKVSLLIELGQESDAIHGGFVEPSVFVHPSGEPSTDSDFFKEVQVPRQQASFYAQYEGAAARYGDLFARPVDGRRSAELFGEEFMRAFQAEFGVLPETLKELGGKLEDLGLKAKSGSLVVSRQTLIDLLPDLSAETSKRLIDRLIMPARASWDSTPEQAGYYPRDWYPWKYRRQLSLLLRPFIQLASGDVMLCPYGTSTAFRYLVMGAFDASLGEEHFRSQEMTKWIGKKRADRGLCFNERIANAAKAAGFEARANTLVRSISGRRKDEAFGDFDALIWSPTDRLLAIVECKDLFFAKTAGEAAEQLSNFRGKANRRGKPDELAKHLGRVQWARENIALIARFLRLSEEPMVSDLVVFSRSVPMQYYSKIEGGAGRFCESADFVPRLRASFERHAAS